MISRKEARIRNLIMKITKAIAESQEEIDITKEFTDEEIKQKFYFKISDIEEFKSEMFDGNKIKLDIRDKIKEYLDKHKKAKGDMTEEEQLEEVYRLMDNYFKEFGRDKEEYDRNLAKAIELAKKLHYKYLPVYLEQYILNNGIIPEDDLENFYNHFHSMEDLYRYIFTNNKVDWKSTEGDVNLGKEMTFKVYTSRWGHHDHYRIERTIKGWNIEHLTVNNGEAEKNGEGALLEKLKHDGVFYPKDGVMYAFETLWEEADTTEMSVEELQSRLDDISLWIEKVEKANHEYQPAWCGYY